MLKLLFWLPLSDLLTRWSHQAPPLPSESPTAPVPLSGLSSALIPFISHLTVEIIPRLQASGPKSRQPFPACATACALCRMELSSPYSQGSGAPLSPSLVRSTGVMLTVTGLGTGHLRRASVPFCTLCLSCEAPPQPLTICCHCHCSQLPADLVAPFSEFL